MKSQLRSVRSGEARYQVLAFVCPGCAEDGSTGLHMLAVNTAATSPSWTFDGNLDAPTLSPSILTRTGADGKSVCHSFLRAGVFDFLSDCTHSLAGQKVPMPDLPDWFLEESNS